MFILTEVYLIYQNYHIKIKIVTIKPALDSGSSSITFYYLQTLSLINKGYLPTVQGYCPGEVSTPFTIRPPLAGSPQTV